MNFRVLPIAAAFIIGLAACENRGAADSVGSTDDAAPSSTVPTGEPEPAVPATTPDVSGDGVALGLLGAVNKHEIAAAQQARSNGVSGDVLAYADLMEKDHGENQVKTEALGQLAEDAEVAAQKEKGNAELAQLGTLEGDAYKAAYIDAMIKGHTEVLALIDTRLLPLATGPDVEAHLATTRKHVAHHLEQAKALKK